MFFVGAASFQVMEGLEGAIGFGLQWFEAAELVSWKDEFEGQKHAWPMALLENGLDLEHLDRLIDSAIAWGKIQ